MVHVANNLAIDDKRKKFRLHILLENLVNSKQKWNHISSIYSFSCAEFKMENELKRTIAAGTNNFIVCTAKQKEKEIVTY